MRATILTLPLILGLTGAASADCVVHGQLFIQSPGPFAMAMSASSGKPCNGNFLTTPLSTEGPVNVKANWMLKSLWVTEEPKNGRVELQQGGYYRYTSSAGFKGRDTFKMRLCGIFEEKTYCTVLAYSISVG